VNTHYHWDHLGANPELRARGADLVGQAGLPALARVDTTIAELDWHREPARPEAIPNLTFADSTVLRPGGRGVRIYHLPAAHTGADAAVWIPDADVLHAGDVYELEAYPFVDWWAGGSFDGIVAAVDRLLVLAGPRTRIVPGHGPVSDREELERYGAMLREARRLVREARAAGQAEAVLLDAAPWRHLPPGRWGSERSARQFFQQLYRHLPR